MSCGSRCNPSNVLDARVMSASANAFDVLSNGHTGGQGSVIADYSPSSSNAAAGGSHSGIKSRPCQQGAAGEEDTRNAEGWQPQRKQRRQRRATTPAAGVPESAAGSSNRAAACDVSMNLSLCQAEKEHQTWHPVSTAVRTAPAVKTASLADDVGVQSPNTAEGGAKLLKAQSLVPQETLGELIGEDAKLLAASGRTLHQRSTSQPPGLLHGRVSPPPTSLRTPLLISHGSSSVL